jgi:pimeloyl-[acyl-carrier protein] methyl ester esterase
MTTLVLLPGMDGTGELFEPFIARLPSGIRAKVVSYPVHEALGYDALVERVIEHLPRDEPFAVLGESFSGPVAIAVAARSTPVALILACSFASNPRPALAPLRSVLGLFPTPGRWIGPLAFALMGRHATPDLREALARAVGAVAPAVLQHRAASVLGVDVEAAFASVRCPTLVLQASEDRIVPPSCARRMLRLAPATTVITLEGPHFLLQTRPVECAEAVATFLRRDHV